MIVGIQQRVSRDSHVMRRLGNTRRCVAVKLLGDWICAVLWISILDLFFLFFGVILAFDILEVVWGWWNFRIVRICGEREWKRGLRVYVWSEKRIARGIPSWNWRPNSQSLSHSFICRTIRMLIFGLPPTVSGSLTVAWDYAGSQLHERLHRLQVTYRTNTCKTLSRT